MKKRLASLLLATAFVFAAGAAFAWNISTPVPSTGDLVFSTTALNVSAATKSADLKASSYTAKDNPFSFGVNLPTAGTPSSIDNFAFGVTGVVTSNDVTGAKGINLSATATDNTLILRIPVAGAASTTEIPVVFFGNTSQDKAEASFDIKFSGVTKASFDVSFAGPTKVTSLDAGFGVGKLTVKLSKDIYGKLGTLVASLDTTLAHSIADGKRSLANLHIYALKNNAAVRVTYSYNGVNQTPIITDLVSGTNTIAIPTMMGSATSVAIVSVENIGNTRLVTQDDGKTAGIADNVLALTVPTAAEFFAGAAWTGSIALSAGDTKTLFGGTYTVKVTWGGNVDISAATTSGDAATAIADAAKNAAVNAFAFNKATGLGAPISGLNLTPTFGTIDSADFSFTASVDAELIAQRADATKPLLSALAFNARVTSPDADKIAMLGLDMTLEVSGDVLSDRLGAAAWKAMRTKLAANDTDSFLAAFSFYKYFAASSTKVDLISFVGAAKRSDYFTVALTAGDTASSNVTVQFKNVFLADGPSSNGKAEAKFETINGREVLVLFDGVRDGWIKDPTFVDGKTTAPVTTYTVAGTVKGSDGAGIQDVLVSLGALTPVSTDATGAYTFTGVSDGTYTANFSKAGYQSQSKSVTVAGANVTVDAVTLVEGANLVVDLQDATGTSYTGSVTFTVTDASSDAFVASADVTVAADASIALVKGDYKLAASTVAGYTVTLGTTTFTIDSADVAAIATIAANAGDSSGGGCNVGFAPLALLLLAPVMFLKK